MTKIKNSLLWLLILVLIFEMFGFTVFAEEQAPEYVFQAKAAQAVIEEKIETEHCSLQRETGALDIANENGFHGVWIGGGKSASLGMRLDDTYWNTGIDSEYAKITVEYLDKGNGWFTLRRQSSKNAIDDTAEKVTLTNTGEKKSHTFYVSDIILSNGLVDGFDFLISTYSTAYGTGKERVLIHSIKIEKALPDKPVTVTMETGRVGNILSPTDSSFINMVAKNTGVCAVNVTVSYTVTSYDGNTVSEGEVTFPIAKGEEKRFQIDSKADKYNCYTMSLTVKTYADIPGYDSSYESEDKQVIEFSRALTWEEGDERNSWLGFDSHAERYNLDAVLELQLRSGVETIRSEFNGKWDFVERGSKGAYSWLASQQKFFDFYNEHGMKMIQIAGYGHPFYPNQGKAFSYSDPPTSPEGIAGYANYIAWMAANAPDCMTAIETWNEYNDMAEVLGEKDEYISNTDKYKINGATYVENMAKPSYAAMKKVNPNMALIGGDTAQVDHIFLESAYQNGLADSCDAISVHPYSFHGRDKSINIMLDDLIKARNMMDEYGLEDKPLYVTELGWFDAGTWVYSVSTVEQAEYMIKAPVTLKAHDLVDTVFWYCLEETGSNPNDKESNYGIVQYPLGKQPYTAKPAYLAACALNKLMPNAVCSGMIEDDMLENVAYKFDRTKGDNIMVFWATNNQNHFKTYDLGCESVELYDMYGNFLGTQYGENGKFTFDHSERPQYAVGSFSNFELTDDEPTITYSNLKSAVAGEEITVDLIDSQGRNLTIEADTSFAKGIDISRISNITAGKGSVTFDVGMELGDERQVRFTIKDGEKIVASFPVDFRVTDPASVVLDSEPMDDVGSRWYKILRIENLSKNTELQGVAKIKYNDDEVVEVPFYDLDPETIKNVYFNTPLLLKKRSDMIEVEVEFDNGYRWAQEIRSDYSYAPYAYDKPQIDGIASENEWSDTFWVYADMADDYETGTGAKWRGVDDLSLKAKFKYDEDNFYMLAVVCDDQLTTTKDTDPSTIWNGDSIQIGFENHSSQNLIPAIFTELGFSFCEGKPITYRWSSIVGDSAKTVDEVELKIERDENQKETTYEVRIPWSTLYGEGFTLDDSLQMGFSMLANDADGAGRTGWIQYNRGIGGSKSPTQFGRMNFVR